MLKYVLLGFLNYSPQTGYELKQTMDQSTSFFWHAKQSQVYTTLKALEEEGLVVSHVEPQEERPDRRVYTITENGKADLGEWLARPLTEIDPRKETLLLKVFFSAQIEKETLLTHLRLQRQLHAEQLRLYQEEIAARIHSEFDNPLMARDARFWEATRRMGELFEGAVIHWLDETIAMVEAEL